MSKRTFALTMATAILASGVPIMPAFAKQCFSGDARAAARAYSRAVTTEGGRTIWLAGHTGTPFKDFDSQVREIFDGLDKTIKMAGGSGLSDMVTMTVFITDVRLGDRFTELRREAIHDCYPASALITVTGLAQPGLLLEIQGVAVVGGS